MGRMRWVRWGKGCPQVASINWWVSLFVVGMHFTKAYLSQQLIPAILYMSMLGWDGYWGEGWKVVLSWLRAKVPKKASDPFSYAIFGTFALSRDNTSGRYQTGTRWALLSATSVIDAHTHLSQWTLPTIHTTGAEDVSIWLTDCLKGEGSFLHRPIYIVIVWVIILRVGWGSGAWQSPLGSEMAVHSGGAPACERDGKERRYRHAEGGYREAIASFLFYRQRKMTS